MIFDKLGDRIHDLIRFSFFGLGEIITIDFNGIFTIPAGPSFIIEFIICVILTVYLLRLAWIETHRRHQGLEAELDEERSKFAIYSHRIAIFGITTILTPLF